MDPWLSYSVLFFSLILSVIFFKHKLTSRTNPNKFPPGPRQYPVIGNLYNLIGSLPHHAMRDLSLRYGPVMLLQLGETPTIVVSSPEGAREIMKTHDILFATRPLNTSIRILTQGGKGLIFSPYGEYWRQLRKICITELLSMKRVLSFRLFREQETKDLIETVSSYSSSGEVVYLSERIEIMMNDSVARAIFGSKCKEQEVLLNILDQSLKLAAGFNLADLYPSSWLVYLFSLVTGSRQQAESYERTIAHILYEIIEQHRERKKGERVGEGEAEDLVDILLKIYDQGTLEIPFDIDTIRAVIADVFGAGTETSSTTLAWAMSELVRNPVVMKKLQSEIREHLKGCTSVSELDLVKLNYLHLVIKETLRLHPPVPLLLPRQCRESCRISGYDIPKGATVLVNVWAIGRDPKYWEDPEEFKPERFINNNVDFKGTDFEFLPFGAGRRMCPGMSFGLANVELPLASLLYHFDWKLPYSAKHDEIDMSESLGITARRKTPLKVLATQYKSSVCLDG